MNPASSSAPATEDTRIGLARVRAQLWGGLRRAAFFMTALSLAIASLFTALEGGGFGYRLLYAACIGLCCWALTDGTRLLTTWLVDRARVLRGQALDAPGFRMGWGGMIPLMGLAVIAGPVAGTVIGDALTGFKSGDVLNFSSSGAVASLTVTLIACLTAVFVLTTLERLASARNQAEAARREAAENQLKLLESQLEPHMLFNTLANLRVLITLDPVRAQQMLDRLIAFLRATLSASRVGKHPLAAEFERVGDYLALMAVRMGPRLELTIDLPAALRDWPVPPLLLQPLVENSIQHGLEPQVEGGRIEIGAALDGAQLLLTVRDTGVGLGAAAASSGTRFGLEQVRSRLKTLYGDRASLSLQNAEGPGGGTLARINLPMESE